MLAARLPALENTPFPPREFVALWALAALSFGAGDVLTTLYVLRTDPAIVEANLLIVVAVGRFGSAGLVGLKLAGFALCLGISLHAASTRDAWLYYFPPAVLAVVGTFLTVYNVRLLLG